MNPGDPLLKSFRGFQERLVLTRRGGGWRERLLLGFVMLLMAGIFLLAGVAAVIWGVVSLIMSPFQRRSREPKTVVTWDDPRFRG